MKSTPEKSELLKNILGFVLLLVVIAALGAGCEDKKYEAMEEETQRKAIEEDIQKVAGSAEETHPISVGANVPKLTLRMPDDKPFNLNEAIRNKPTVLVFYRGGWCPFCNKQLAQLREIEPEITKSGFQIIAISPDRPEKLAESIDKHKMNYLLLSDSNLAAAKAFGIAFKLDETTVKKYAAYGIDLVDASGQEHYSLPVPAVFVVGTDGIIKFEYANPDYKVRLEADKLLSVVKLGREKK